MTIGDLVELEEGRTLNSLARSEGEYYATVSGTITDDDISKATSAADEKVEALDLPKGVTTGVAGVAADMAETFTQLRSSDACSNCYCILHPSCNIR